MYVLVEDEQDTKPFLHEEKSVSLLPGVKTEPIEEPLTLEGEPHALLSVKREIKEETVPITKAETTSAQPTTGMSSHSITAIVCGASYMSTATWNLRGVEVCGEMTVVVHSSHGQQIIWPGYGLRLNIPKGCLPAGMEQCTINIKASLAGQYEFPENSHLVSAIFWLRCEDVHKFTKPITVEIQHCAKSENVTNLSFVRAVCSQEQLPYTFKQLPGSNFTSHSSYGVIEQFLWSGSNTRGVRGQGILLKTVLYAFDTEKFESGNRFCSILEYRSTFNSESVLLRYYNIIIIIIEINHCM